MDSKITYYPVGNGDQSLISVFEGEYTTHIIVDCNIRASSENEDDDTKFNVKADLLKMLNRKADGRAYTDVFVLSHGDCDHCRGFETHFYQGDPHRYGEEHRKKDEIFIDVLWFSPMAMEDCSNPDAECFKKEAYRRIQLHHDNSPEKDNPGNRIVIIGYNGNEDLNGLHLVRKVPGDIITRFNERELATFSVFIHAPYKRQLASAEPDKNHTSIVFQARFKDHVYARQFSALAMFGGDADYIAWSIILQKTLEHGNDKAQSALDWDIFLAPHHCSWTFFNETPQEKFPEPEESSLEILRYRRPGGKVIASSKKIKNNDDNPPHFEAKKVYLNNLESAANFLNTAIEPSESAPEPIVFLITPNGPVRPPKSKIGSAVGAAGGTGAASKIVKQG